jgi:hypothetical protein
VASAYRELEVRELELQIFASRVARSREAISRQPPVSMWDRKWKTGGRFSRRGTDR